MNDRRAREPRLPHPATVCLCWLHPLVLSDFRRLLAGNGLRVCERRLEPEAIGNGKPLCLPRASVYVVEAHPHAPLNETVVARLLANRPGSRFLIVAERLDQKSSFSLLSLGVKGLISFDEAPALLRRAVKEVVRDGFWVSRSLLSRFIDSTVRSLRPPNPELLTAKTPLSRREYQVCGLLLDNLSNREIASRLDVSERTAKFHVSNLLAKYGLRRRADLVVMSYSQLQAGNGPRKRSRSRGG